MILKTNKMRLGDHLAWVLKQREIPIEIIRYILKFIHPLMLKSAGVTNRETVKRPEWMQRLGLQFRASTLGMRGIYPHLPRFELLPRLQLPRYLFVTNGYNSITGGDGGTLSTPGAPSYDLPGYLPYLTRVGWNEEGEERTRFHIADHLPYYPYHDPNHWTNAPSTVTLPFTNPTPGGQSPTPLSSREILRQANILWNAFLPPR